MTQYAYIFPGQGSQSVGMVNGWQDDQPVVDEVFRIAADKLGYDLLAIVSDGPESELNRTEITQPAMLCAGVASWRIASSRQDLPSPTLMAGHSLGEYTALVCAGAIDFVDGVRLVQARGRYMQQAVPAGSGAMAAILGLDDDAIAKACEDAAQGQVVSPVNFNCPGQVVIAGEKGAVERAVEACKAAGAKRAVPLPVSVPSHCALMRPAAEQLAQDLAQIEVREPQIPVVQNVDAKVPASVEKLKQNLLAQLYSPVLWTSSVEAMLEQGVETTIECGPGKVLSGLNKKVQRSLNVAAINEPVGFAKALGE